MCLPIFIVSLFLNILRHRGGASESTNEHLHNRSTNPAEDVNAYIMYPHMPFFVVFVCTCLTVSTTDRH